MVDISGNTIISSDEKVLSYAFRGKGNQLLIIAADPQPKEIKPMWEDEDFLDETPVLTQNNAQICDQSLKPVPILRSWFFKNFVDNDLNTIDHYDGLMQVTDTTKRIGYVDIGGVVSLKSISFKYRSFTRYTANTFMVEDTTINEKKLIDRNNRNLTPGVRVTGVRVLREDRQQHQELFYPASTKKMPLLQIYFNSKQNTWAYPFIFMSESGRLYGVAL